MRHMKSPVKNLIRRHREAQVHKMNAIIARNTVLIEGTDENLWPHDVALAQEARKSASFRRVDLLHKLSKEN